MRRSPSPRLPRAAARQANTNRTPAIVGLVFGLLIGVLLFAPARWLGQAVEALTEGRVLLHQAEGTIWDGRSRISLADGPRGRERRFLPEGLRWQLRPGWGESWKSGPALRAEINAPCCTTQPLRVSVHSLFGGQPGITLAEHRSRWPADWLSGLGAPFNTLALQGQLLLQTPGLRWQDGRLSGEVELQALDISSALSTLRPLGSYRVQVTAEGGAEPRFALTTISGDLRLSAEGRLQNGRLRMTGLAETKPERAEALSNLLNILGRRDGLRSHLRLG